MKKNYEIERLKYDNIEICFESEIIKITIRLSIEQWTKNNNNIIE